MLLVSFRGVNPCVIFSVILAATRCRVQVPDLVKRATSEDEDVADATVGAAPGVRVAAMVQP